ncbi:MAG: protein-glutamate O-methyltransferase CheR, partial [Acidobacteriota bacterium]
MHPTPSLSLEELALFNELLSSHFGLHFPEHKREILESRLLPRLRANHLQRFLDYYLLLQYD